MSADKPTVAEPAVAPTRRNAMYYKMDHPKRGIALIFTHETYSGEHDVHPRRGTDYDCMELKQCLGKLGFDVKIHKDLKYSDLTKQLEIVSEMNHTEHDCLVVAVLTHEGWNELRAYDMCYNTDIIWSYFAADKCPTLAGKPKIFFIQACQALEKDRGHDLMERTQTDCSDSSNDSQTFRIPCYADFLIAYACLPELCKELTDNGKQINLLTLLALVNQRVAIEYQTDQKKQVLCITSTLTRIVKF